MIDKKKTIKLDHIKINPLYRTDLNYKERCDRLYIKRRDRKLCRDYERALKRKFPDLNDSQIQSFLEDKFPDVIAARKEILLEKVTREKSNNSQKFISNLAEKKISESITYTSSQIIDFGKSLLWSMGLLVGLFFFWYSIMGNPFDELALILNGRITSGKIEEAWEENDGGWYFKAIYTYQTLEGEFKGVTKGNGRLKDDFRNLEEPYPMEVEYLSDNPTISRIRGDGSQSVYEWFWRKGLLGGGLLIAILSPGFILLRSGIRKLRDPNYIEPSN